MGKFAAGTVSAATAGFFAKAGFHPPEVWVYVAAVSETAVAVALVLGICTRFAALGAVALLAIYSLQVVKGFGWPGIPAATKYPAFWAIVSFSVAIEAWKWLATKSRARLASPQSRHLSAMVHRSPPSFKK